MARSAKERIRREVRSLTPPAPSIRRAVVDHLDRWLQVHRPKVVVGFLAMADEIDFTPLVGRHPEIRFGLTRTKVGTTLTVHAFDAPRERHRHGFEQPVAEAPPIPLADIDVVLVPGLAFSRDGRRLGRGAGYYDRFLSRLRADKVALTVEARIRNDLPVEPHDVLMDWIATESGIAPTS